MSSWPKNDRVLLRLLPPLRAPVQQPVFSEFGSKQYLYYSVIRGQEADGVKILLLPERVHSKIVEGLQQKIEPSLTWWQRVIKRFARWRWLSWLNKYVPQPKEAWDWEDGKDFLLTIHRDEALRYRIMSFGFVPESSPAGTPEQIKTWQNSPVFNILKEDVRPRDEG